MIGEYKINRTTRRCSVADRPLEPGEYYYSVVSEHDEDFRRVDIAADSWTGPPEGCIGHWKNRVPLPEEKKRELAPPEVLIEILRSMADQPQLTKARYLLALMLVRKRHLKPVESSTLISSAASDSTEPTESESVGPTNLWELESNLDGTTVTIEIADIAAGEAESLQTQLVDLLYREVE
ncbi:hypothetical protein SAMN06265222_101695 [Neorhodopirellula lusitana]|uniref:Uncharacterized protein n=1 Tax=Neorhodopirellula lusitana TaxID=445327 RepID=A0ABY1PQP0_9BACT|nr:hypothetical protein [Neorhodopirellula lusitana]SMP42038.1 hypothetical protein SAMN06265222_101695 [Neorhodopirellula lusitana]